MAAVTGDLIQLVDNQSYLGQQVLNVYYYRIVVITGLDDPYLNDLNTAWATVVLPTILAMQADELLHVSREWRNMSNGVDIFTDTEVIPGDNGVPVGDLLPSYVSAGFMLQRDSLVTRNGYKRFAGLFETLVEGNTFLFEPENIEAVEEALAAVLNIGLIPVAAPVIVKRPIEAPVEDYEYSGVQSATFRSLGTQNSRKAGRGV